jgi:mRNA interferase YafQ
MYSIKYTNRFKKDYKLCKKRGLNIALLKEAIAILEAKGTLPLTNTGAHADLF